PDSTPDIEIGFTENDDQMTIYVQDQGIGIPAESHEKIFELFVRLHSKDEFPGSGMGLAQCKRIVEKYDGTISVQSEMGQGARFELSFHSSFFSV
ncbi:MAG: ATP-binding protein, partial [Bacteroidota bacterium]